MAHRSRHISTHARIALVGTCRTGLGHLRRLVSISAELKGGLPNSEIVLITNAPPSGMPSGEMAVFSGVTICERRDMARALSAGDFDLAVLDTVRLPGLAAFKGATVLVLRETPDEFLESFRRDGGLPWDQVIVPNPADHWMPRPRQGFARSIYAAGWILRQTGIRKPGENAGLVVATGGGGTDETRKLLYPLLDDVIARARVYARRPFRIRQAIGPRSNGTALAQVDEAFDPGGSLNDVFRAADVVISTAGYNSVLELASTDTPTLLAAIPRSIDDQAARVRRWGPKLGLGLESSQPDAAARWLADQIERPRRRAPVDLGTDGASRAAAVIVEMLCPVS